MAITKTWREAGKNAFSVIIGGDVCPREQNNQYVAENAARIVKEVKDVFRKDAEECFHFQRRKRDILQHVLIHVFDKIFRISLCP